MVLFRVYQYLLAENTIQGQMDGMKTTHSTDSIMREAGTLLLLILFPHKPRQEICSFY